jgi:uncharacterized protein (DUF1778 family)
MSKSKILNVRIEPDLKKMAKKLAEKDGRTLSNWVTRLIQQEVQDALAASPDVFGLAEIREKRSTREKGRSKK